MLDVTTQHQDKLLLAIALLEVLVFDCVHQSFKYQRNTALERNWITHHHTE